MSKAVATRLSILQNAFELIYQKGFQATSIDDIIATTQVTKGAFFYHFRNKEEMGIAMIQEVMAPGMQQVMVKPLLESKDPVTELYKMMKSLLTAPFFQVQYGCPAVNLIDEMAPLHPAFHEALLELMRSWQKAIETSVRQGKKAGTISADADAKNVAYFMMAGYSGIRNMGKLLGPSCYAIFLKELKLYLNQFA